MLFKKSLYPCALGESSLSTGRVKRNILDVVMMHLIGSEAKCPQVRVKPFGVTITGLDAGLISDTLLPIS